MGRIGAHVSTEGGPERAIDRALAIGAECLQIFVGAPQNWASPRIPEEGVAAFRAGLAENGLGPLFIHAPYLVNLASLRPEVRGMSRRALGEQLAWADRLGALGVVVHVGSGGDDAFDLAASGLEVVLRTHTGKAALILENDAGSGRRIGARLADLGGLIRTLGDERLLVCFDTAHGLAAGYEVRTATGLDEAISELDAEVGLDRLALVHANDSKVDLGRNVDRHENIGRGKIGVEAFARLLAHPALRPKPFVLEVPGYAGEGPDRANVALLRLLAEGRLDDVPRWEEEHLPRHAAPTRALGDGVSPD